MWYWNQNYFEGLREVAETYAHRPNFKLFSKYCRLKEEGHKKAANAESVKFVMHTSELPLEQRREIAAELAELGCLRPSIHSLINHPIEQFVRDTLKKWVADEPDSLLANRFYAFHGGGQEFLEIALRIKPDDQISLVRLSYWMIDDVDYMVHHLDEGVFLGEEHDAKAMLTRVAKMIEKVQHETTRDNLLEEHRSNTNKVNLWSDYKQAGTSKSFPNWASEKGFDFHFPQKFYYQK